MERDIEVMVVTRRDLVKWAQEMPINEIGYEHVKDRTFWLSADRVEFRDHGKVRVLKNRFGPED